MTMILGNSYPNCSIGRCLTIRLLPRDTLDVNHELATVARLHLTLTILVRPADNHDLVSLTDGQRSHLIEGANARGIWLEVSTRQYPLAEQANKRFGR